jgi:hypothetical protein
MIDNLSYRKLVLIELNEINFDVVNKYVQHSPRKYPFLKKMLNGAQVRTTSEHIYEELEPWVQWVSVHTGLTYSEHGVYRLGDIVGSKKPQFFEKLEGNGLKVGAISAMNAENRLKTPAYFIPDPWTLTPTDGSWWSRKLSEAVSQAVNDNAQARLSYTSVVSLLLGLIRFAKPSHYIQYIKLALGSRGASWRKALFLDLFLHDVHMSLYKKHSPNFSTLFLNAGAHIQHHYFLNAKPIKTNVKTQNPEWYVSKDQDPIADMLEVYDRIVGEYLSLPETEVIVATGLSQIPYDRVKFYYRLKNHESFLKDLGIQFNKVVPRMTRDFLIEFDSSLLASDAQKILSTVKVLPDDVQLFGGIDNRGSSLFVTLTFPHEIKENTTFAIGERTLELKPNVVFVAIKNGMHQGDGFAFFTEGVAAYAPADLSHVKELHGTVMGYFGAQGGQV